MLLEVAGLCITRHAEDDKVSRPRKEVYSRYASHGNSPHRAEGAHPSWLYASLHQLRLDVRTGLWNGRCALTGQWQ